MNQDEWEELANRRERLHPELAEYLMETPVSVRRRTSRLAQRVALRSGSDRPPW